MGGQVCHINEQLQQLTTRLETFVSLPPAPVSAPSRDPVPVFDSRSGSFVCSSPYFRSSSTTPSPEWFSGDSGNCRPFLVQCGLHFELQASTFQSECSMNIITHLTERAKAWVIIDEKHTCQPLTGSLHKKS